LAIIEYGVKIRGRMGFETAPKVVMGVVKKWWETKNASECEGWGGQTVESRRINDSHLPRFLDRGDPSAYVELLVDVINVFFHGFIGNIQGGGDFLVAHPFAKVNKHLLFPLMAARIPRI
jgi:hypothetical protein